tara:strand:+ start:629 stop:832 length:204 start_codon:yes stop_codon:yes gene_type:complete
MKGAGRQAKIRAKWKLSSLTIRARFDRAQIAHAVEATISRYCCRKITTPFGQHAESTLMSACRLEQH